MKRRKAFSREFKLEAVRLFKEGKKIPSGRGRGSCISAFIFMIPPS
jgi:transposase-like protein